MDETIPLVMAMTTVGSTEDANMIARDVVGQCLAACVQIDGPVISHYRWAGNLETASEFRLMIKTSAKAWPALKSRLTKLHPYDEPEIFMHTIDDASDGYRAWVIDQTT